ncbi:MAG: radical SAM protein [Candidatus Paceibacterota bacterium]|jgi:MoaA/NifB/PqqE/SkfB family radical SAM enzyme
MKKSGNLKRFYNRARILYYMLAIKAFYKKPYPFYVNLVINSNCNLRCAYCFGRYSFRSQAYWEIEDLKKLIDDLYKRGTRYVLVQGGEPLLHPNIGEIFKYLDSKNIVCAIVSNGTLPNRLKEISELALLDNICFSLDGNREGNDKIRGQGTFDKVMESIKVIKENFDIPIRINSTIHKYVISDCNFMAEFVKKNNIEWGVSYLFRGDEKLEEENLAPTKGEIYNYQKKLIEYKKKGYPIFTATKILQYVLNWPFGYNTVYVDKEKANNVLGKKCIECQYGNYEIVIDEDGSVYPCQGMQGIFNSQNIHHVGFDQAFQNLQNKPCHTCYIIPLINTSAMINWDLNVIFDTIWHTFRTRFLVKDKKNGKIN